MNTILKRLLPGSTHRPPPPPRSLSPAEIDIDSIRREVVAIALRETLRKHGIPATWITAETAPASTARRERGAHVRLAMREWRPELLPFTVALQKTVRARIARLDPAAADWLTGITWKFEPYDETRCPAMPGPEHWGPLAAGTGGTAAGRAVRAPADFSPTEPMLLAAAHP